MNRLKAFNSNKIFFALLFLCFTCTASANQITISEPFKRIEIGSDIEYLEDRIGSLSAEEVALFPHESFFTSTSSALGFGYTQSVYWLRFHIVNPDKLPREAFLEIDNPLLDSVKFYTRELKTLKKSFSGDLLPFRQREVQYRTIVFNVSIPPGESVHLIRIETTSNMNLPIILWDRDEFRSDKQRELAMIWIYYGIMLAMFLFGMLIFILLKDRVYLLFSLSTASFALFRIAYNGLAFQFLWPESPWWSNRSIPFFVSLSIAIFLMFSRDFLQTKRVSPALDRSLLSLATVFSGCMVMSLFTGYRFSIQMVLVFALIAAFLVIIASLLSIKRGSREAVFYTLGWGAFIVGSILNILREFSVLPINLITSWGQQMGSVFQILFISMGLVDRINTMKNEITVSHEELKKASSRLESETELLSVTMRSIADGVMMTDLKGTVLLMNRTAEMLLNADFSGKAGIPVGDIFRIEAPDAGSPPLNPVLELIETGITLDKEQRGTLIDSEGRRRNISFSITPVRDRLSAIIGAVVAFRDITEMLRIEQEILKTSKLESLATFASGIAHDFNNILTVISGNLSLIKNKSELSQPMSEMVTDTEKITFRAKDLTRQLLTFAKGGNPVKRPADLKALIIESAGFITSGSNVKIDFSLPDDLWVAEVDEGQIAQAVDNIVINAMQAMPHGGSIYISAENIDKDENGDADAEGGPFIAITIRDEGTGIPEENLGRIFDPFFTTKPDGSGLGLSSTYSIIKRHGGDINVESEPGHGSSFRMLIPALGHTMEVAREKSVEVVMGSGKILIMDDEELVLRTAQRLVGNLGYSVECARDGEEMIRMYLAAYNSGTPYDALIMDLTVPGGMGGLEAVKKLREINPSVKAIVSSGYSNDPVMSSCFSYGFCDIVVKPYDLPTLSHILHRVTVSK
ncbi:MAG: ATP-binding protein [Spirochaetes bacterium]|nr:ATP-binding protein [Spirochaetota bacterium]